MFDYNFIDAVEKRYNDLFSYGGSTERSFFQNVGKIVNKKSFMDKENSAINSVFKNTEEIMNGNYHREK